MQAQIRSPIERLSRRTRKHLEELVMKIMQRKFLLTTASLLASVGLASAQGMREGGGGGAGGGGGGERGMSAGPSSGSHSGSPGPSGAQRSEGSQTMGRGQGLREGGRA